MLSITMISGVLTLFQCCIAVYSYTQTIALLWLLLLLIAYIKTELGLLSLAIKCTYQLYPVTVTGFIGIQHGKVTERTPLTGN